MTLLYGLLVGVAMGVLLQRVRASSPLMIARMLRLENLTILKFMALTIAVGAVASYVLSFIVPMHFDVKPVYVLGVLGGGLVFGAGFGLGGYCPGTCVVGAGEGRKDALFTILGGIVGALIFTVVYRAIEPVLIKPMNYGKLTLADVLHVPTLVAAVALAVVFIGAIALMPTLRAGAGEAN